MANVIDYILQVSDDESFRFSVDLDFKHFDDQAAENADAPEWVQLETHQCVHCPLTTEQTTLCPLACRIKPFIDELGHLDSTDSICVTVVQGDRSKQMIGPVQDILGSLLGLFMATSQCPHTRFLRPMAHFHLPLADPDETIYRVLSMYRLAQFFKKQNTGRAYAGFEELQDHYMNMVEVNHQLSKRIRLALKEMGLKQDGALNAIILLDALSQYVPASIDDAIEELEPIFSAYWEDLTSY